MSMEQIDIARPERPLPYQGSNPADMRQDIVIGDVWPQDERWWVPIYDGVWSRPLQFNVTQGSYSHLMRVTRQGAIACHRHAGPVLAHVLRGRWYYLEHDWVATEGSFVFEPPGETHTLVVPEDCEEMATLFHVTGALIYVAPDGTPTGYDDVFTRLEKTRAHFERVGLGRDRVDELVL